MHFLSTFCDTVAVFFTFTASSCSNSLYGAVLADSTLPLSCSYSRRCSDPIHVCLLQSVEDHCIVQLQSHTAHTYSYIIYSCHVVYHWMHSPLLNFCLSLSLLLSGFPKWNFCGRSSAPGFEDSFRGRFSLFSSAMAVDTRDVPADNSEVRMRILWYMYRKSYLCVQCGVHTVLYGILTDIAKRMYSHPVWRVNRLNQSAQLLPL